MRFLFINFACYMLLSCSNSGSKLIKVEGSAQGTTYHISYIAEDNENYKSAFDSLLRKIDTSFSTYLPVSIISRINKNDSTAVADKYFTDVFNKAMEVSQQTGGLFDVTVAPLVNAWGFGFTKKATIDSAMIDSLRRLTGYKMVKLESGKIVKAIPGLMLDFNAIGQGYSVDVLAAFLENKGTHNYLVELGGELIAKGKKYKEEWTVGIDQPNDSVIEERTLQAIIKLNNRALSTSGNYRQFYVENGQKFAHTIDPRTGYPAKQNILSATVLANDCTTADAYATAFMVMGLDKAKQFLTEHKALNLEVYFIYDENGKWKTFASESLKGLIQEL
ncbi:MAG: FAD:protein FMN transferase [Ferruginibacter sp.]